MTDYLQLWEKRFWNRLKYTRNRFMLYWKKWISKGFPILPAAVFMKTSHAFYRTVLESNWIKGNGKFPKFSPSFKKQAIFLKKRCMAYSIWELAWRLSLRKRMHKKR